MDSRISLYNDPMIIRVLNSAGVDINGIEGILLFSSSVQNGRIEMLEFLLELGFDIRGFDEISDFTSLMLAAFGRNINTVKFLLDAGADPNRVNSRGVSTLMNVLILEQYETAELLLKYGADVNAIDEQGYTSLMLAAQKGNETMIKFLLKNGADKHIKNKDGLDAVTRLAIAECYPGVIQLLVEEGEKNPWEAWRKLILAYASFKKQEEIVNILNQPGSLVDTRDKDGMSMLAHAATKGYTFTIELLLRAGADVNETGEFGNTILAQACLHNKPNSVYKLLNWNVKLNIKNIHGLTPLALASGHFLVQITKILIAAKAELNQGVEESFVNAAERGRNEIVELLLGAGINRNAEDERGVSALLGAVTNNKTEIVEILLKAGANTNNHEPLMFACFNNSVKIVELLLEAGADPNVRDINGETPLMVAVKKNGQEILKLLLKAGADPNIKDEHGHTAYTIAKVYGNSKAMTLLQ